MLWIYVIYIERESSHILRQPFNRSASYQLNWSLCQNRLHCWLPKNNLRCCSISHNFWYNSLQFRTAIENHSSSRLAKQKKHHNLMLELLHSFLQCSHLMYALFPCTIAQVATVRRPWSPSHSLSIDDQASHHTVHFGGRFFDMEQQVRHACGIMW